MASIPRKLDGVLKFLRDGFGRTPAEIAASVTPTDYSYPPAVHLEGDVRRINILLSQGSDFGPYLQNAIDAAPYGGVVTIPAQGDLYLETNVNIDKAIEFRGNNRRYSNLIWAGGAGTMISTDDSNTCDNLYMHDFNIGHVSGATGTVAIQFNAVRGLIERIFANPFSKFTGALIKTRTDESVYSLTLRNCDLHCSQAGAETPIGLYAVRGHTINVESCMFSGFLTAVKAGVAGSALQGFSMDKSRIEAFSGTFGAPGSATAIGVDVVNVDGLTLKANNFEMNADQIAASTGQRCVVLRTVRGGEITGGFMTGNGDVDDMLIEIADTAAKGVEIHGIGFSRIGGAGYLVGVSGTGALADHYIHSCYGDSTNTTGAYDNSFTPGISFGGGTTGITYGTQLGKWSREGEFIHAHGTIILTNKGSSTGALLITGLPVTARNVSNNNPPAAFEFVALSGVVGHMGGYVVENTKTMQCFYLGTGSRTQLDDTNFGNTSAIKFSVRYQAAPI